MYDISSGVRAIGGTQNFSGRIMVMDVYTEAVKGYVGNLSKASWQIQDNL